MSTYIPIAVILWNYQQGVSLYTDERQQLAKWLEGSEERRLFFQNLVHQKEWLQLTLHEFFAEFETSLNDVRTRAYDLDNKPA